MLKRTIARLLLPLVLLQLTGCTKQSWIGNAEPRPERLEKVRAIRTADGDEVRLDSKPAPVIQNDTLHATIAGERYSIATENIVDYKVARPDIGRSIMLAPSPARHRGRGGHHSDGKPSASRGTLRAAAGDDPTASSVNHTQETSGTRRARVATRRGGVASMPRSPHLGFSQKFGASRAALDASPLQCSGA